MDPGRQKVAMSHSADRNRPRPPTSRIILCRRQRQTQRLHNRPLSHQLGLEQRDLSRALQRPCCKVNTGISGLQQPVERTKEAYSASRWRHTPSPPRGQELRIVNVAEGEHISSITLFKLLSTPCSLSTSSLLSFPCNFFHSSPQNTSCTDSSLEESILLLELPRNESAHALPYTHGECSRCWQDAVARVSAGEIRRGIPTGVGRWGDGVEFGVNRFPPPQNYSRRET